jgi:predicted 2-oxoglutarate/Fe(II)-dependent dioxygenase YbiX
MELDVQNITGEHQQLLTPFMIQAGAAYNAIYSFRCERTQQIMNKFSAIRFNRYGQGQIMRQHMDHIHSLWGTQDAGIPVLSFILNLNDDYEGAELFFWDDYVVPLGKGDIIMFPSLFLFPHGVKEATKGRRISAVSWGW